MTTHSEAFKALLTLEQYCEDRECEDCCFHIDNYGYCDGYCPFDTHYLCPKYIANDLHDEISKRVYFLEQLDIEVAK